MIRVKDLSSRHRRTFNDIMTEPPKAGVKWDDIISLIEAVSGVVKKSSGLRRKFQLGNTRYHTHEPHPQNTIDKGALTGLREWFVNSVGVKYD